ncbi:hypothetical protein WJ971_11995 [Achromobacter xylosoxidans]
MATKAKAPAKKVTKPAAKAPAKKATAAKPAVKPAAKKVVAAKKVGRPQGYQGCSEQDPADRLHRRAVRR